MPVRPLSFFCPVPPPLWIVKSRTAGVAWPCQTLLPSHCPVVCGKNNRVRCCSQVHLPPIPGTPQHFNFLATCHEVPKETQETAEVDETKAPVLRACDVLVSV